MALAQRLDKSPARTFVLMGDGECAEGQVWEAAAAAAHGKLKQPRAPSSTSTGSANPIRPCTSTTWPRSSASSRPSAGRPSSSTATRSTRSWPL
ncbi:MAG: hypothetical protein MZU95_02240 [Desulfomicrobium escambiense]|nr:hypothetical protein [Desulfomicrobium escambiense]